MTVVPGRVKGVAVMTIVVGLFLIYTGYNTALAGSAMASGGSEYEDVFSVMGGFWKVLGLVYLFIGLLCFPVAVGLLGMKDWARKNGAVMHAVIATLSMVMGMIVGFYYLWESIPFFIMVALSGICMVSLSRRVTKNVFEFHGEGRSTHPILYDGSIREVYRPKVVVRHQTGPVKRAGTMVCPNCSTVNMKPQENCRVCGTRLG
ncbi:MAG: hypothetical protein KAX31_00965 [Thermoplasmata archaeon]|nr:hypothetical protein [Thermoplasmata archaeon]